MKSEIVITGIGAESAYGSGRESYWRGQLTKTINLNWQEFDQMKISDGKVIPAKNVSDIEEPEKRLITMGKKAVLQCLQDWGGRVENYRKKTIILGSGLGLTDCLYKSKETKNQKGYLASLPDKILEGTGFSGDVVYMANSCCAGIQAISYGMDLLDLQETDLVVAGGLDMLSQIAFGGFLRLNAVDREGCRPFDQDRSGITVGEGACFFVLERKSEQHRCIYGVLAGSYVSNDAYHIVQMEPEGKEIQRCILEAMNEANISHREVDLIVAHGTGTKQNDKIEAEALHRLIGREVPVISPKGTIGHTGGASGVFGLLTAIGAVWNNVIVPTANVSHIDKDCRINLVYQEPIYRTSQTVLINAFAFGGTNVVIVLRRHVGE